METKSAFQGLKELENRNLEWRLSREQTAERDDQSLAVQDCWKKCVEEEDLPLCGSRVEEVCPPG